MNDSCLVTLPLKGGWVVTGVEGGISVTEVAEEEGVGLGSSVEVDITKIKSKKKIYV